MARWNRALVASGLLAFGLIAPGTAWGFVRLDFVLVGDPGNEPDDEIMTCCDWKSGLPPTRDYGAVAYRYRISLTEMPTWAYVEFLNAVAASDPNELFITNMTNHPRGNIDRFGAPGAYTYAAKPGRENRAANFAGWFDAARFVNWLHNGQPGGAQDASTTEDGVYTLLGTNPIGITRNPGARFWISTEEEWYKAAYHLPGGGYVDYATGSDVAPIGEPPPGGTDSANYCPPDSVDLGDPCPPEESNGPDESTDVGAYPDTESAWGIQDGVGNMIEFFEGHYCCRPESGAWQSPARGGFWVNARGDNRSYARNFTPLENDACHACSFRISTEPPRRSCGLGWEVALVMAGLVLARERRRRHGRGRGAEPTAL